MFPKGMINDIVVTVTPMCIDPNYPIGVMSIIGSSISVMAAGIPFDGPVGAAQIAYLDGQYIVNPTNDELEKILEIRPGSVEELRQSGILPQVKVNTHGQGIIDLING